MKRFLFICLVLSVSTVNAEAVLIAGSSGESPPPFWEGAYGWVTPSEERGFSFSLGLEGQYSLDMLEVAVFRHDNSYAGSEASFTIRPDVAGLPGETVLDTFIISNVSLTKQILTSEANEGAVLSSGLTYWIVGRGTDGQVNWNLGDNAFGLRAMRSNNGDWTLSHTNLGAFAIHGTAVPEPCSVLLFGLGGALIRRRKR